LDLAIVPANATAGVIGAWSSPNSNIAGDLAEHVGGLGVTRDDSRTADELDQPCSARQDRDDAEGEELSVVPTRLRALIGPRPAGAA
jgi:hypothetical protein